MFFLIYCVVLTYICICTRSSIFDIKADEYIKKYLHGVYTARPDLKGPTDTPFTLSAKAYLEKPIEEPNEAKNSYNVKTNYYESGLFNLSKEEFEIRKLNMEASLILDKKNNTLPDFEKDEIGVQTRRFEGIRELPIDIPYRREYYFNQDEGRMLYKQKNRTVLLMEQFIYETRYKLPYVQLLQTKYKHTYRYKLGFCFAILQHLKQEQHVLYTTMKRYMKKFQALFIHIKMYEKIIRLDVDIRDVVAYIKKINWERMQVEEPVYFDQVKNIQQKK